MFSKATAKVICTACRFKHAHAEGGYVWFSSQPRKHRIYLITIFGGFILFAEMLTCMYAGVKCPL